MRAYWEYLKYVCRHIRFVRRACFASGLYWQGLVHDWSKFLPGEFFPYAVYFYGSPREKLGDRAPWSEIDFQCAWRKHFSRNPHHWEYWVIPRGQGKMQAIEMPERFLREMLCDWWGASMAMGQNAAISQWYEKQKDDMVLHPKTRAKVEKYIPLFDNKTEICKVHFGE